MNLKAVITPAVILSTFTALVGYIWAQQDKKIEDTSKKVEQKLDKEHFDRLLNQMEERDKVAWEAIQQQQKVLIDILQKQQQRGQ